MKTELEKLAVDHPYYCSDSNYFSRETYEEYETWNDFYEAFRELDIDLNLIFRWDIKKLDNGKYFASAYVMQQRKGKFVPHMINQIEDSDVKSFKELMAAHWEKLNEIWTPLNKQQ